MHGQEAAAARYALAAQESYATQLRQLLADAAALDEATIAKLTANRAPNSATGPMAGAIPRQSVPVAGTDPATVHAWWDGLAEEERRYVVANHPDLVGNLDGVPIDARDQANRIVFDQETDRLQAHRHDLADREAYLRQMMREGRLAEVYPDLAARGLSVRDAALFDLETIDQQRADSDGKLKGIGQIADRLNVTDPSRQRAYLIGFSTEGDGRAVVSIGNPDTADNVLTYVPGTGADITHPGGDIKRAEKMAIDASPGVGTNTVTDLHGVSADQVWSTRADGDPIHFVPDLDLVHGNDPTRDDFGGRVFTSDPGGHSDYWNKGNQARRNIAIIATGQGVVS
ncbi:MAG: hypothetical protein HKP61_04990 [Dactylosporangium sp.]|nr:chaperonin family protein RbcX [Dactylosporangium sp.]NNJ60302.1 hypothetical protein [Dactylosporangium sp.]